MEITELRKFTGLSQSEFAKKYDISLSTLQHWEQGCRKPPEYVVRLLSRIIHEVDYKEN